MADENLPLVVEEITTLEGLEALRPQWSELWSRSASATPFQAPEWILSWWRHMGKGQIWSLALKRGGELKGLAPLYVDPDFSPERRLLWIGTGVSDYLDLLLDPDVEQGGQLILEHLHRKNHQWDSCDLHELRSGSPFLKAEACSGWKEQVEVQGVCLALPLPRKLEELPVSKHFLRNFLYYRRRLERLGAARFECAERNDLEAKLDALFRLHDARWRDRGGGVLKGNSIRDFHRDVAAGFLSRGILRFHTICVENQIVACMYAFRKGDRVYSYLSAFENDLHEFSLGFLILGHAIECAIQEGAAEFDFLRGCEPYKYRWGPREHLNFRRQFIPLQGGSS